MTPHARADALPRVWPGLEAIVVQHTSGDELAGPQVGGMLTVSRHDTTPRAGVGAAYTLTLETAGGKTFGHRVTNCEDGSRARTITTPDGPTTSEARRKAIALIAAAGMLLASRVAAAQTPLASGQLSILGVELVVSPASQTVPKNQATGLTTALVDPSNPTASVADPSLVSLVVKGELSGPGIGQTGDGSSATGVITLSTPAGQLLPIPPLLTAGNYVVDDLRLEDGNGNVLMPALPARSTSRAGWKAPTRSTSPSTRSSSACPSARCRSPARPPARCWCATRISLSPSITRTWCAPAKPTRSTPSSTTRAVQMRTA